MRILVAAHEVDAERSASTIRGENSRGEGREGWGGRRRRTDGVPTRRREVAFGRQSVGQGAESHSTTAADSSGFSVFSDTDARRFLRARTRAGRVRIREFHPSVATRLRDRESNGQVAQVVRRARRKRLASPVTEVEEVRIRDAPTSDRDPFLRDEVSPSRNSAIGVPSTMVCDSAGTSEYATEVGRHATLRQALEELLKCMLRVWCREGQALARFGGTAAGNDGR